jgi:hypothetical protein
MGKLNLRAVVTKLRDTRGDGQLTLSLQEMGKLTRRHKSNQAKGRKSEVLGSQFIRALKVIPFTRVSLVVAGLLVVGCSICVQ